MRKIRKQQLLALSLDFVMAFVPLAVQVSANDVVTSSADGGVIGFPPPRPHQQLREGGLGICH